MKESDLTRRILAALRKAPRTWCVKFHGGPMTAAGVPDILGVHEGRFFAVEVKTATGKVTKLQAKVLALIAAAGGRCGVARSVEDAVAVALGKDEPPLVG